MCSSDLVNKVLKKAGPSRGNAARVAERMGDELKDFIDNVAPMMALICTPGLQERHWADMEALTGLKLPRLAANVQDMVEAGLVKFTVQIEDICVSAQKEAALVKVLDKMEEDWAPMIFETKE